MNLLALRYRRFHVSYVLGYFCAGILVGLALSRFIRLGLDAVLMVSLLLCVLALMRRRRWWSIVLVAICGVLIGIGRGNSFLATLAPYQTYVGSTVVVGGSIKDDPQYGDRGDQQFKIHDVTINGVSLPGEVFVGTYSILDIKRGDTVKLNGKLCGGFGNYQAALSFATLQSATATHDPVREFRDRFAAGVRNIVEEPAASLGIGFVVGQRSALPDELDEQLRVVGLTHIVVASGYNLTILVRFSRRMLEKYSKYLATAVSVSLMTGFVAVSGLSPSMTRAALVTSLSLLAWYYGRRFHPLLLILYAAACTALLYPVYVWSDIGRYLSFLAFAGVLLLAPLLSKWIFKERSPHPLLQIVVETIAAQIMTLPLILAIFGELPVLSVIANAIVAPVIPVAMLLTAAAGIGGMVLPQFTGIVGTAAEIVLGYVVAIVQWLAAPSWSQIVLSISPLWMAISYGVVSIFIVWLWRRLRFDFRSTSSIE